MNVLSLLLMLECLPRPSELDSKLQTGSKYERAGGEYVVKLSARARTTGQNLSAFGVSHDLRQVFKGYRA